MSRLTDERIGDEEQAALGAAQTALAAGNRVRERERVVITIVVATLALTAAALAGLYFGAHP
jgi:hypothetical protein